MSTLGLSFREFDERIRGAAFVISGLEYAPPAVHAKIPPGNFHPGDYLQEFMDGQGWTQDDLDARLGPSGAHINRLIFGKTRITEETATELADVFDTSAELWLNLQAYYDQKRPSHYSQSYTKKLRS